MPEAAYGRADDTCWPIHSGASEYALRYGGELDRLHTASVLAAYRHLTDPSISQRAAIASLMRARRIRKALEDADA